ncbi:hypothetical protein BRD00_07800 [Halobacteriales archaeon QS_8_69_26]|nr:MAG: hypothetical protein BRD00_07800 [Halobacteriales archaeon QS_8_69_26]
MTDDPTDADVDDGSGTASGADPPDPDAGPPGSDPGSPEGFRTGDIMTGVPLILGGIAWVAAVLGVTEFSVGGATVGTAALATALLTLGFFAHAYDRILVGEPEVAAVVTAFAAGLPASYLGRTGGDATLELAGTALMVLGVAAYTYLTFRESGSGGS